MSENEVHNGRTEETELMPYFVVIRERSSGWNWSVPMRRQAEWEAHAAFMDALESEDFILAGGPLGDEDDAARVMHVVAAPDRDAIETRMAEDPWTPALLLRTASVEPWTVLLGGFRAGRPNVTGYSNVVEP